ncbi:MULTISPECIES: cytochrome c biogenesis protein ResB [unclassified Streptomyces]|uniref:cytochrome c biogenesis protein ResB n=1 Tax=unclassified Streptomyces TaxID=2593676 RepID=UPI001BE6C5D1|nr:MULTISPECIES: cytochrome c biogenesis protein ResB [unclassified Streptomyces]MBT2406806.1 cytochrome c biogenesis protein ResB [Streptomyces sp. ISL-21]MBT2612186.1 cytochrome c biogenesis protein ResB [Streptomyces sp. ISL-87]
MSTTDKASTEAPHSEDSAEAAATAEAEAAATAEATAEAAAGAQLSTAPQEEAATAPVGIGVLGWARWFWRQLTSMRVALILLLLLSLASIPGSLIPQTQVDEMKVAVWKQEHASWVTVAEKLQLFDVYSSVWFSAIYLLLFISLIGCILPRSWQFVGQLRGRPPGAPKRLDRLPAYATWRTEKSPGEVLSYAKTMLGERRFRTEAGGNAVAAEKGYLREAGNLLFHIALIVMLIAFAWGQYFKSEGGKLVLRGKGFSNTLTQYDDFKHGALFESDDLPPFSFTLDKFDSAYERTGPQKGTARDFKAYVTFSEGADGKPQKREIEVNKPLEVDGSKVYLLGHGYAPVISVTDPTGKVIFKDAVPMLPQDSNLSSTGAVKVTDGYKNKDGKKEQLGFAAMFVPTFAGEGKGTMFSQFPELDYPVLALNAWHGSLGVDSGLPQNVYQLDTSKMEQFKGADGQLLKQRMRPGETMTLPDGAGTVKFEGIERWATFSITQQPGSGLALGGAIAAIGGLAGSLFIQRRRIWVRAVAGEDGVTVVEMAGLGRSESPKLPEELTVLSAELHQQAPTASAPPVEATVEVEGERK